MISDDLEFWGRLKAVELGNQLENAATGIDFGKQQPCAAVGGGDLVEVV